MSDFLKQFDNDPELLKENKKVNIVEKKASAFKDEQITLDRNFHYIKLKKTIIVCTTILIIFIFFVLLFVMNFFAVVINFENQSIMDMQAWAEETNVVLDIDYETSNEVEENNIIQQSKDSGSIVNSFSVINVKVSKGPDMEEIVSLENFESKSDKDIENFINEKKLSNAEIEYIFSEEIEKNEFVSIEFPQGVNEKNHTRSDKIIFYISKGKESEQMDIKVPNFEGKNISDVESWGTENMIYINSTQVYSQYPVGTVLVQDLDVDSLVARKSFINLEISKGMGIPTPSFYGLNQKEAEQLAMQQKITVSIIPQYSTIENGQLISQSFSEGEAYFEDDVIKLFYSIGKPFISDMTGIPLKDAIDMIEGFNLDGANLTYDYVYKQCDEDFPKGSVCSVTSSGEFVDIGKDITIYVQDDK